jgi:hypothetical protein
MHIIELVVWHSYSHLEHFSYMAGRDKIAVNGINTYSWHYEFFVDTSKFKIAMLLN